ncbi:MAG: hypothetical protein RL447_1187 [Bacteroidota bacterium]|jgi:subtilisin family serine protease
MSNLFSRLSAFVIVSVFALSACTKSPELTVNADAIEVESTTTARTGGASLIQNPQGRNIKDAYIVVFNDDVQNVEAEAAQMTSGFGGAKPDYIYKHSIKGFSIKVPEAAIRGLLNNPKVKYIEQDQISSIDATTQTGATWGLDRTDQRNRPLDLSYTYNTNGSTVDAYIFDTGILPGHIEFSGRVLAGFDAFGSNTVDGNGHGTHVAGTVGGTTYGIAKGVKLIAVRVLDNAGSGSNSGVVAGIDWAVGHHTAGKPAVGNMSLGGGASTATDDAVRRAVTDGIVMVVAAGNSNANAANYSPARTLEAITVGATTSTDARASYSNFGSVLDIFAPGSSITSAWYTSSTALNTISGTSMASPHVAGVAALYLEAFPGSTPDQVSQGLKTAATPNVVTSAGTGSPNLLLFSGNFSAPPPPPPAPVAPALVSPANGATGIATIPTLTWNGTGTNAASYDVQVSTRSNFSSFIENRTGITGTSLTTRSLKARTIHYWRVRSKASNGTVSAWSATWGFTTR